MGSVCISGAMTRAMPLIVVGILVAAVQGSAADAPLSLEQAVQSALSQNATLRAARAATDETAERRTAGRSGFFPQVSFSESFLRGDEPVFAFSSLLSAREFAPANFAIDALNHPDPVSFFRATVGVEQLLFDGGRQRAAATSAGLQDDIARASSDETAQAVARGTTHAFGLVLQADAGRAAAEAAVAAAEEDRARTEHRRDAGLASDGDVLALAAHVAALRQRVIQAAGDAAVARAELNQMMGVPVDAAFTLVPPDSQADTVGEAPLPDLLAEADRARPELRRAAASLAMAEADGRQAHSALLPQLVARGAAAWSGMRFGDRASAWILGGELRWHLSLGGGEIAGMRASGAAIARARAEQDAVRAAVQVDVVTAQQRLATARARQEAGRAAVADARESQRIVRDRFDAGLASVTDVLRASTAVLDAEASQVSALVEALDQAAALRQALGRMP